MDLFGTLNVAVFDWPWSGIHFMSGATIGLLGTWWSLTRPTRRFWSVGLSLLAVWEVYEATLRYLDTHHHQFIAGFKATVMEFAFGAESGWNVAGDLLIGIAGMALMRWVVISAHRYWRT